MVFIEAFFRRCVEAGQKDGSITDTRPADELAKLLLSVLLGIRVLARTRPQREVLEGAANGALALLGTARNHFRLIGLKHVVSSSGTRRTVAAS